MAKQTQYRHKGITDEKALTELEQLKVKCVCGHTQVMPVYLDKKICSFCGRKVINNSKLYFLYKLRKEIRKNEK